MAARTRASQTAPPMQPLVPRRLLPLLVNEGRGVGHALPRRRLLSLLAAGSTALSLGGCDVWNLVGQPSAGSPGGSPLSIAALRLRRFPPSEIRLHTVAERHAAFTSYLMSYASDELRVTGMATIPTGPGPFPVVLLNHGYVLPSQYATGEGTRVMAYALAHRGYLTLATDYRGLGGSEDDTRFNLGARLEFVIDVLNLASAAQELPEARPGLIGVWGHSLGGELAVRAAAVNPWIGPVALWAPLSVWLDDLSDFYGVPTSRASQELRAALVAASLPLFPFAGIRPLAVGLLAAAAAAALALHHRRTGSRLAWLLPPVFVVWGNVHASFPIGFALLGALFLEALWARSRLPFIGPRPRTRLVPFTAVAALSIAGPALNPSGPRLLAQPFFQWGGEFRRFNSDWRPPEALSETWWFFAAFLVLIGLLLIVRHRRVSPTDLVLLVVLLAAGYSTRKVMPFAAVMAPLLLAQPLALTAAPRLRAPAWAVRAAAALTVAVAIGVAAAIAPRTLGGPTVKPMPAVARDLAAQTGATRVFSTYHWGAYLTWALWPDALVYIDGRFDLFIPDALADYLTVTSLGPGWQSVLRDIAPEAIVIETDSPLAQRLKGPDSGWSSIGGNAVAQVFLPNPA